MPPTDGARGEGSLLGAIAGDGTPLLSLTAFCLILSGAFAIFLSARGEFLPHDVDYLGIPPGMLCELHGCRIVHFMFHDRVAFGGSLIAIGVLYLWLAAFPLRARERWAWWTFVASGLVGFASFLSYLGYGYLDSWHGVATLALLPAFAGGLWRSRPRRDDPRESAPPPPDWRSAAGIGRGLLLFTGVGMILGGGTILVVGMTAIFVPQDLEFIGATRADLEAVSDRLLPLIAHDRAGFGGGICATGIAVLLCAWFGRPTRSFFEAFALAGAAGFGAAIGVHFVIGYTDFVHLAPAYAGALLFVAGLVLRMRGRAELPSGRP